ncbi:MAG: RNase P subunit p30 family protein [Candidatus Undinarchaeales archaeon]|jgi:ribonuclease P/MRP protein subunit RPP1|nr:RNase P subunit p30 family protein [Candidatus Undinarchaeales archaeon]
MYDIHNKTLLKEDLDASRFSIKSLGVVFSNRFNPEEFAKIKSKTKANVFAAVELKPKSAGELKEQVKRNRKNVDVILVDATDVQIARAAAQMSDVDVISHAFVDQPTARDAAKNNVALEINLKDILQVYGMKRAILISKINFNLKLARKYKTPLVITTGAESIYDMRSPKQIMIFMEAIGFKHDEAKKAIFTTPKKIVEKR